MKTRTISRCLMAGLLVVVLLACKGSAEPPPLEVPLSAFVAEYDSNPAAADTKYKDKVVKLTGGYVHTISSEVYMTVSIQPSTAQGVARAFEKGIVMCRFDSKAPALALNSPVVVIGRVKGKQANVGLRECRLP